MAPNRRRVRNNRGRKPNDRRGRPRSAARCCSDLASSTPSSVDSMKKMYRKIKIGLKKSVPAALLLYPFHKIRSKNGLTSRRIISFLRRHYGLAPGKPAGQAVGHMLRCAVEFGLINKRGNRFYLMKKNKVRW